MRSPDQASLALGARFVAGVIYAGILIASADLASAQAYPSKPIRLITAEPGGGVDFAARIVAQGISGALGQPVIVENRGGGGNVSGEIVTKAAPDGYTLLVTGSTFWGTPLLRKTSYDPVKGFSPVAYLVSAPNILVVHPSVPVKSVRDLIDLAKAKPGALNYASSAIGSSAHLAGELFKSMTGVIIVHIPYKGTGPAIINLIGDQVQMMFATAASVTVHIKSGKLKAVAVSSARPSALFPELPTVAATVPGYETVAAAAMFAPPKTPAVIVNRLNREIVRVLNQPEVKETFLNAATETVGSSPEQLAASVKADMIKLGKLIKEAGIRAE